MGSGVGNRVDGVELIIILEVELIKLRNGYFGEVGLVEYDLDIFVCSNWVEEEYSIGIGGD